MEANTKRINRARHLEDMAKLPPSPVPTMSASKKDRPDHGAKSTPSSRQSGPFSRANNVRTTDEVPPLPSLIFDTGAEASFVPDNYTIPTSVAATTQLLRFYYRMVEVYRFLAKGNLAKTFATGCLASIMVFLAPRQ